MEDGSSEFRVTVDHVKMVKESNERFVQKKLKEQLKEFDEDYKEQKLFAKVAEGIVAYLKTLSPSGIELEFLSLASFDFESKENSR